MSEKRVYTFGNGQAEGDASMREVLGGKGANLAEMNHIGVPVPPGFTITTDTCNEYYEVGQDKIVELLTAEVDAAVAHTEELMNCKFGDPKNPLLGFCTFRCSCFNAGYDGYHPQPWFERRGC